MNLKLLLSIAISTILILNPLYAAKDNKKNLKRSAEEQLENKRPRKKAKISATQQKELDLEEEQKKDYPNPITWENIIQLSTKLTSKDLKNYIKNKITSENDKNIFLKIFKRLYCKNLSLNDNYFTIAPISKYMKLYYFKNEDKELHLIEAIENILKNPKFNKSIALEFLNIIISKKIPNNKIEIVKNCISEFTEEDNQSLFALSTFRYIANNYSKFTKESIQEYAKKIKPYKNLLTLNENKKGFDFKKYFSLSAFKNEDSFMCFINKNATQESINYLKTLNENEAKALKKIINKFDKKIDKNKFIDNLKNFHAKFPYLYLKNFSLPKEHTTLPIAGFFEKSSFYTMNDNELNIFLNDYVPLFKEKLGEFWKDAINASGLLSFKAIQEKCNILIEENAPNKDYQANFIYFMLDCIQINKFHSKIRETFSKKINSTSEEEDFLGMPSNEINEYINANIDLEITLPLARALTSLTQRNLLKSILKYPNLKTLDEISNLTQKINIINNLINNLKKFKNDSENYQNYKNISAKIFKKLFNLNLNLNCEKTAKDLSEFITFDLNVINNLHKSIIKLQEDAEEENPVSKLQKDPSILLQNNAIVNLEPITATQIIRILNLQKNNEFKNSLLSRYKIEKNKEIQKLINFKLKNLDEMNHADHLDEIEKMIKMISSYRFKFITMNSLEPLPKNLIPIFKTMLPEFNDIQISEIPSLIVLFIANESNMIESIDLLNGVFKLLEKIENPNILIRLNQDERNVLENVFKYFSTFSNFISNEKDVENRIFSDLREVDDTCEKRRESLLEFKDSLRQIIIRIANNYYADRQSMHSKKSHADVDKMIEKLSNELPLNNYAPFKIEPKELQKIKLKISDLFKLVTPHSEQENYNVFLDSLSISSEKSTIDSVNIFTINIHPKEADLNNTFSRSLENYYNQFLNNPKITKEEKERTSFREIFNKFCVHIEQNKRLSDKDQEITQNEINAYIDAFLSYHAKAAICKIIKMCILIKDDFSGPVKGNYMKGLFALLLRTILKIQKTTSNALDLQDKFLTLRNNLAYANIEYVDEKIKKKIPFQQALQEGQACPYGMSYNILEIFLNNTSSDKGLKILAADLIPVVMYIIQSEFERIDQLSISIKDKAEELKKSILQILSDPEKYDQTFWEEQKDAHIKIDEIIEGLQDQFTSSTNDMEESDEIQIEEEK